ncbi:MAG: hypothetical protein IJM90_04560 [Firmicutes bacterium]|nr:hypothetical protein [Bacillota bacterium]
MSDLIDRQALYERAATLEAQALDYVGKLIERDGDEVSTEWRIWSAILTERTAFKHDVFDAPSAQPEIIRCQDCKHWDTAWTPDWSHDHHYCPMIDGVCKGDFYCADAERREE